MQTDKDNAPPAAERDLARIGTSVVHAAGAAGKGPAAQRWLNIQCNMVRGVSRGLVFRVSTESINARVEANWPEGPMDVAGLDAGALGACAAGASRIEELPATADTPSFLRLYHPLAADGELAARLVVVLEMTQRDESEREAVVNLLRWNSEWLRFSQFNAPPQNAPNKQSLFPIVAACFDQEVFRATAMTLVSELAARFACQRVSFGLRRRRHVEVQVLSHSAGFKQEANLVQAIGAAMDEAVDQDKVIRYSAAAPQSNTISHAHAQLASHLHEGQLCTVPVTEHGDIFGALTLERDGGKPFSDAEIHLLEQVLAVVAPILLLRQLDERSWLVKSWHSLRDSGAGLVGPEHLRLKVASLTTAALLLCLSIVQDDFRVTADALVEGSVQRTIAAPMDGYIATVAARAGDVVEPGDVMGTLDDSDLRLEQLKWSTLRQQMASESREARAQHNRAEVSILNARLEQADAELQLLQEQMSRTRLVAPFKGVVIEGDLSQLLGTPVSRGDVLFKVAPLDDYRIVLNVDEKDIAPIEAGQHGRLILASMPDQPLDLQVEKITTASDAADGRNVFRVEARLASAGTEGSAVSAITGSGVALRPGMEGVGKIEVGEASLLWIWTHDLVNWLRLQAWTWWR